MKYYSVQLILNLTLPPFILQFLLSLAKQGFITQSVVEQVAEFIKGSSREPILCENPRLVSSLEKRMAVSKHPVTSALFELMISKQSNLCVAADLATLDEVISLAEQIGSQIVVLKIHIDIYDDFEESKILRLKEIAKTQKFLIMEDRYDITKFSVDTVHKCSTSLFGFY